MIRLKIFALSKVILDKSVDKIIAEDGIGSFCLLPKHIDCVRVLVPGILTYELNNQEKFIGVDEGILVKCKEEVRIAVKNAIVGEELGNLRAKLEVDLKKIDEFEKKTKTILTKIEMDFIKKYLETTK